VIQITPSFGLFTGGFGFHYGAERIGAMAVPVGAGRSSLQLRLMRDLKTTVITAIATYPLRLIEVARDERFDLATLALRVESSAPRCGRTRCAGGSSASCRSARTTSSA